MQQIGGQVVTETGYEGANVSAIATGEGMVLVDAPMLPTQALHWREAVRERGPIRYLVHTEYHPDHVRGGAFFPEATIVAHEIVWERTEIAADEIERYQAMVRERDPDGAPYVEGYAQPRPEITFRDGLILRPLGATIELRHLPGHTPAQTAVFLPDERILFPGDNVVFRVHPYLADCLPESWLSSLAALAALDPAVVVPGHGEVCGPEGIAEMVEYLREAIGLVRDAIAAGWTRDEATHRISLIDRRAVPAESRTQAEATHRMGLGHLYDALQDSRG